MKYNLLLALLLLGCQREKTMSFKNDKKEIIENYIHSYNSFDVEGMMKDLDKDVVFENITDGKVDMSTRGIDEFRKQAEVAKGYFRQREQKITTWHFNDSTVTINIDYKAILAIELPNGMKPGDTLVLKGQSIFKFRDNKIEKIQDKS